MVERLKLNCYKIVILLKKGEISMTDNINWKTIDTTNFRIINYPDYFTISKSDTEHTCLNIPKTDIDELIFILEKTKNNMQ